MSVFGHDSHGLVQDARNRAFPNADLFAAPILTSNPALKNELNNNLHDHNHQESGTHTGGFKELPCCSAGIRFPSALALAVTNNTFKSD